MSSTICLNEKKASKTAVVHLKGEEKEEEQNEQWVSPFTPDKVDPMVLMKEDPNLTVQEARKQINKHFPTKSQLRNVIPAHCFERSVWRSLSYLARDLLQTALVAYLAHQYLSVEAPTDGWTAWIVWRASWQMYALFMTLAAGGLWVLGHECGHSAFSPYPWVNGIVGWTLHSCLLVPYFTWAYTHAKHHRRTNDLVDGETHIPPTAEQVGLTIDRKGRPHQQSSTHVAHKVLSGPLAYYWFWHAKVHEFIGDEAFALFTILEKELVGFPMYLIGVVSCGHNGADGKPIPKGTFPDHFRPHSRMFPAKMYWKVVASDIGIALVLSGLAYCTHIYGFTAVYLAYFMPYLHIQMFLVFSTWLHHTDPTVPHFDAENWTWIKGAVAGTIDRPMRPMSNTFSHNICSTHVVHHLFHQIPHYNAVEATQHIKAFLEPQGLYNCDPTEPIKAMWKIAKSCHYVKSNTDGVQYYQSFAHVDVQEEESAKKVQ